MGGNSNHSTGDKIDIVKKFRLKQSGETSKDMTEINQFAEKDRK